MKKGNTKRPVSDTPWFVLLSPELGGRFRDFTQACLEIGVLDTKTKELLMLVLASVFRCPHGTDAHLRAALEAGVSKEEIAEALLIAAMEGAGTQLTWAGELFRKYLGAPQAETNRGCMPAPGERQAPLRDLQERLPQRSGRDETAGKRAETGKDVPAQDIAPKSRSKLALPI